MIPVDADVLFQWYEKLEEGEHKQSIRNMLRASPFWAVKDKRDLLQSLQTGASDKSDLSCHTTLRGSSSTAPAPILVEHSNKLVESMDTSSESKGKEILTVRTPLVSPPSPTHSPINFVSNLSEKDSQEKPASDPSAVQQKITGDCLVSAQPIRPPNKRAPTQVGSAHNSKSVIVHRPPNSKRPAEPSTITSSAKRSLDRSLLQSATAVGPVSPSVPSVEANPPHSAAPREITITSPTPTLRRSSRQHKGNASLSSFVVGSASRKPRATKPKPDVVKEALVAAELSRCLDSQSVVDVPLSEEEQLKIKNLCGIIDTSPTAPSEEQALLIPQPQPPESEMHSLYDDDLGEKFTGMDDFKSDGYTDLDDEADGEAGEK